MLVSGSMCSPWLQLFGRCRLFRFRTSFLTLFRSWLWCFCSSFFFGLWQLALLVTIFSYSVYGSLCAAARPGRVVLCCYGYVSLFTTLWQGFDFDGCPSFAKNWGCIVSRRIGTCSVPSLACCLSVALSDFETSVLFVLRLLPVYRTA